MCAGEKSDEIRESLSEERLLDNKMGHNKGSGKALKMRRWGKAERSSQHSVKRSRTQKEIN